MASPNVCRPFFCKLLALTHIPHARKLVVSFVLFLAPVLAFKGDCEFTLSVHVKSCVFAPGYMSEHLLPQAVGAMQEKLRWPVTQAGEQQIWERWCQSARTFRISGDGFWHPSAKQHNFFRMSPCQHYQVTCSECRVPERSLRSLQLLEGLRPSCN